MQQHGPRSDRPWAMRALHDFTTWEESAHQAVKDIFALKRNRKRATIDQLRTDLDDFIDSLFHSPAGFSAAESRWAVIGGDAAELADTLELTWFSPKAVLNTLVKKQRDYGSENIRRFGRQGLMVRMHDKVARLENLLNNGATPENESIHDNVLDIIGYAAIGIMWERQQFLLPLTENSHPVLHATDDTN